MNDLSCACLPSSKCVIWQYVNHSIFSLLLTFGPLSNNLSIENFSKKSALHSFNCPYCSQPNEVSLSRSSWFGGVGVRPNFLKQKTARSNPVSVCLYSCLGRLYLSLKLTMYMFLISCIQRFVVLCYMNVCPYVCLCIYMFVLVFVWQPFACEPVLWTPVL